MAVHYGTGEMGQMSPTWVLLLIWPVLNVRRGCPFDFLPPSGLFSLHLLSAFFLGDTREVVLKGREVPGERCPLGSLAYGHSSALRKTMNRIKSLSSDASCAPHAPLLLYLLSRLAFWYEDCCRIGCLEI